MSGRETTGLLVRREQAVLHLTLNRPARRNALSRDLLSALNDELAAITDGDGTRAVVLAGAGPTFCAGGDIAEYAEAAGTAHATENAMALARVLSAIAACPAPVLARVHGDAYGGGVGLLCAADVVVAARSARFSLSEARLGLMPAAIAPYVLRALGERQAMAHMLLAEPFDAGTAAACGLVHRTVPVADLDDAMATMVEQILRGAPGALAAIKRLPRLLDGHDLAGQEAIVVEQHARRLDSAEGREGLAAFLERRQPAWAPPPRDRPWRAVRRPVTGTGRRCRRPQ